jgi:rubrerythrin
MVEKYLADNEILMVAINLEKEGYDFYDGAAGRAKTRETKDVFLKLRDEEAEHRRVFEDILRSLTEEDSTEYFGVMNAEVALYLRTLIDTGVFKSIDKAAIKRLGDVHALEIGVAVEKDSILFYSATQKSSVNSKAKEIMLKIIDIEKSHLVALGNRLRVARKLF